MDGVISEWPPPITLNELHMSAGTQRKVCGWIWVRIYPSHVKPVSPIPRVCPMSLKERLCASKQLVLVITYLYQAGKMRSPHWWSPALSLM